MVGCGGGDVVEPGGGGDHEVEEEDSVAAVRETSEIESADRSPIPGRRRRNGDTRRVEITP